VVTAHGHEVSGGCHGAVRRWLVAATPRWREGL
jgi:hypothetical protein